MTAAAQRCYIFPSTPVAVPTGGGYGFSANCGTNLTWTLIGPGSLDGSGNYSAPSSVIAQNQSRGCQELPNNSPFNIPVNSLPVDTNHNSQWLARVAEDNGPQYHNLKLFPQSLSFYHNVVDNNANQEVMHFLNGILNYQDKPFPIPAERTLTMEGGRSIDANSGADRHMFTINKSTCQETEIYNLYVDFLTVSFVPGNPTRVAWTTNTTWTIPQNYQIFISGATGTWQPVNNTSWRMTVTGANTGTLPFDSSQWGPAPSGTIMTSLPNNCVNCNSQSGSKFSPASYSQFGGADAAGMPMAAPSLKMEEWYAATQAGRTDLGHAFRTTLSNSYLSARYIWPATSYALSVAGARTALDAGTNGNPVVFTSDQDLSTQKPCDGYTFHPPCPFHVSISGFTSGPWMAADGDWMATAIDNIHFSIQLDTTNFGPMPGGAIFVFDFIPYGATIRLKSSFDLNTVCTSNDLNDWCPYAKVYLRTLQNYGMVVADGTIPFDNWDNGVVQSEFHPGVLLDAASKIYGSGALQPIEQYLEVVDRSSQPVYTDLGRYQVTNTNRTQVCANGSYGMACDDVILQGTTIGTDRERLTMAAGVSYPLNVWVNGNVDPSVSYSIDSGIPGANVSPSGLLTMPNCTAKARGMVKVTSDADPNTLPLYIEVTCIPVSSDGAYRLALGNYDGDYTDTGNHMWFGSWGYSFNNNYEAPGLLWGTQNGSWQGLDACRNDAWTGTDSQLYSRSTSYNEDTRVELIVPNGNYTLTLYGEPGFGGFNTYGPGTCGNFVNQNVYDWVVQGQTINSWVDGFVQAGNQPYHGYTLPAPATVNDNVLATVGRMRVISMYGMSWSSLLVSSASPLTINTSSLPHAFARIPYIAHLTAANGDPPYTWSLASGSAPLPPGIMLTSTGIIFGRAPDNGAGYYPFTVQVTDAQQNTATKNLSITVCSPGHLC